MENHVERPGAWILHKENNKNKVSILTFHMVSMDNNNMVVRSSTNY